MTQENEELAQEQPGEAASSESESQTGDEVNVQTLYEQAKAELEKKDTEIKSLNKANRQKADELKRTKKAPSKEPGRGVSDIAEAVAKAIEGGDTQELKKVAAEIDAQRDMETKEAEINRFMEVEEDRILNKLSDAGVDLEDESVEPIKDWLHIGRKTADFVIAEKKADKLIAKRQGEKKEPRGETEAEHRESVLEEARKLLASQGKLNTDTGGPAAGGGGKLTAETVAKMSPEERFARSEEIAKIAMGYKPLA